MMSGSFSLEPSLDSSSKKRSIFEKLLCHSPMHPTAYNLLECPSFEELVQERKFDSICEILSDPAAPPEWLACYSGSSATPLHLLCQHQPTAAVVEKTLQILWTCDLQVDKQGRTPLHCAVQNGVHATVVRSLLGDEFSTAAGVEDQQQRYPLHYAVCGKQHQRQLGGSSSGKKRCGAKKRKQQAAAAAAAADNLVLTVQLLLEAYPDAVLEPDAQGRTPLDLARTAASSANRSTPDPRILASLEFAAKILAHERNHSNNKADCWTTEKPKCVTERSGTTTTTSSTEITDHQPPHHDDGHDDNDNNWFANEEQEWPPLREVAPTAILTNFQGGSDDDCDDLSSVGSRGVSHHARKPRSMYKYVCVDL